MAKIFILMKCTLHNLLKPQFDYTKKAHLILNGSLLNYQKFPPRQLVEKYLNLTDDLVCRVELLSQYDIDFVSHFGLKFVHLAEPLSVSLSCSSDDLEIFYYDKCKRSIDSKTSLIAFKTKKQNNDNPTTINQEVTNYLTSYEFPLGYVLLSTLDITKEHRVNPKVLKFKQDYGDCIDNGGYLRRNANCVQVLLNQLQREFPFFVMPNVKKVGTIEGYCIHPNYPSTDFGLKLIKKAFTLAKLNGVEYVSMLCLTEEQRQICSLLKFKPYLDFPLDKFRDHGEVVFKPITGDPTSDKLTLMIAKL